MRIVKIEANPNGSHNAHKAKHITTVPDGWAMIPEDMSLPESFPFVAIEAEEKIHYREVMVAPGVWEKKPFPMMTVTSMIPGEVPPASEPEPTWQERTEAQITYTAMMTDTLLEV